MELQAHCSICRVADDHPSRVGALFRVMLSADEGLFMTLERLDALFYDHKSVRQRRQQHAA
jgi:hypothetical protein